MRGERQIKEKGSPVLVGWHPRLCACLSSIGHRYMYPHTAFSLFALHCCCCCCSPVSQSLRVYSKKSRPLLLLLFPPPLVAALFHTLSHHPLPHRSEDRISRALTQRAHTQYITDNFIFSTQSQPHLCCLSSSSQSPLNQLHKSRKSSSSSSRKIDCVCVIAYHLHPLKMLKRR